MKDNELIVAEIQSIIDKYLNARHQLLEMGRKYPHLIGGNDNIIGRIGEFIAIRFLERLGQSPVKAEGLSNAGFDLVDGDLLTQVKVITSENKRGRTVRLKKPWNQFLLIQLEDSYQPTRIGLITEVQHQKALLENPKFSEFPVASLTMLGDKGLIGRYGKVYQIDETRYLLSSPANAKHLQHSIDQFDSVRRKEPKFLPIDD